MLVFRIENAKHRGPYMGGGGVSGIGAHRPVPHMDKITDLTPDHFFGFATLADLWAWFDNPKEWDSLKTYGFTIAIYRTDPATTLIGGTQVAFKRREAEQVGTLPIDPNVTDDTVKCRRTEWTATPSSSPSFATLRCAELAWQALTQLEN